MVSPADLGPEDEHNLRLTQQVRPPAWQSPTSSGPYNLLVIGGGSAGLVSAIGAARLGAKVALVERDFLGGDCLISGCVPSKALLHVARVAHEAGQGARFGVRATSTEIDFAAAMDWVRQARASVAPHDSAAMLQKEGVDVYFGAARFAGEDRVQVEKLTLRFKKAIVATGSSPKVPAIVGLQEAGYLTSDTLFSLNERPTRIGIIGAGPIGCEMGQALSRLGSEVTLFDSSPRILSKEHPRASEMLRKQFEEEGVALRLEAQIEKVDSLEGKKKITFHQGGSKSEATFDQLLLATGRAPRLDDLDLDAAGIVASDAGIVVSDRLQTSNRRVYAAGDVCSRYKFTHAANAMARIAMQNALFWGRKKTSALTIPRCTYTDPEVAHVGLDAAQVREQSLPTIHVDLDENDRAHTEGSTDGFLQVVHGRGDDRLRSATIVSAHAGNLLGELGLAMGSDVGLSRLGRVVHPYPTESNLIESAADEYFRRKMETGHLLPWLRRVFSWLR